MKATTPVDRFSDDENTANKPVVYNIVRTVRNRASDTARPFNGGWTAFRRWAPS